jgi:hypothetical protein
MRVIEEDTQKGDKGGNSCIVGEEQRKYEKIEGRNEMKWNAQLVAKYIISAKLKARRERMPARRRGGEGWIGRDRIVSRSPKM